MLPSPYGLIVDRFTVVAATDSSRTSDNGLHAAAASVTSPKIAWIVTGDRVWRTPNAIIIRRTLVIDMRFDVNSRARS